MAGQVWIARSVSTVRSSGWVSRWAAIAAAWARAAAAVAVGRCGTPADSAAAAAFFVREESSFGSGQVLYVAGGPTV